MKKLLLFVLMLAVCALPQLFAAGAQELEEEEILESQFEGLTAIDRFGWEIGKPGGRFVMSRFGSDPKTFNPIVAAETSTTDVTERLFAYIVRRNQMTLEWEPWLAERWEISEDQKSITYYLREGLKWSDGQPLTAEDFVFSVNEIYLNEEVETNQRDGLIVGDEPSTWEVIDDMTFKVTLPEVYAGIFNLSVRTPMPKHILEPVLKEGGAAAINSFWGVDTDVTKIVGCGPFVISEYVPNQKVVLKPNPYYFEKDEQGQQLPYLDEFVILIVEDQDTQLAKFMAGEMDFYSLRGEDYAVLVDKKEQLGFQIYDVGPNTGTVFITFNQNPKESEEDGGITGPKLEWLSTKKFRQAMAHLIDRESIINNVAYGFGYPQYSFIPRFSPYYWQDVDAEALKYDPEQSKQLLDEINFTDRDGDGWREDAKGNKISLVLNTNSGNRVREAVGEMFSQEAKRVGIDVVFRPEDFNALVTKLLATYDWEMILIGLTGSVDPIGGSNVYPSRGNLHMIEPKQDSPRRAWEKGVDAAWDEANLTLDEAQRVSGFEKIQRIWIDELPWAYTFNAAVMHAYKEEYGNIKPHPINGYDWAGIIHRIYLKN